MLQFIARTLVILVIVEWSSLALRFRFAGVQIPLLCPAYPLRYPCSDLRETT